VFIDMTSDSPDRRLLRIFVAEDEALIALVLQDILDELGHTIVGPAASVPQAMSMARDGAFDVALLDVKLGGNEIFPVADVLEARRIPFAFSTGFGEAGLPDAWRTRPILAKPYNPVDVESILNQLGGLVRGVR
jgi:CheY-like chemotaxis protein